MIKIDCTMNFVAGSGAEEELIIKVQIFTTS